MLQPPAMIWCRRPGTSWVIAQLKAVGDIPTRQLCQAIPAMEGLSIRWNSSLHPTSQHREGGKAPRKCIQQL